MSVKKLIEKKNVLIAEAEAMLNVCADEVRALNEDEKEAYALKEAQIKELNETISLMEARSKEAEVEVVDNKIEKEEEKMEERNVNVEEVEVRALDDYFRGNVTDEVRAMATAGNSAIVPTHLYPEVIKKLEEVAPLFSMIPKLTPQNGAIEILKEDNIGTAGFVGEYNGTGGNLGMNDFTISKVKLEQRRCGSAVELSQQLINDSGIDIVGYTKDILYRRLGYALDRAVINGKTDANQFEGLENVKGMADVEAPATITTIDCFMDMLNAIHPEYQKDLVWIMSRPLFNKVAKLQDSTGNYYMLRQLNVVTGKPEYTLLGCPIFINDAVSTEFATEDKRVCYLVNFAEAYKGIIKKGIELKQISGDTANALRGSHTFTIDMYADVKAVNEKAIAVLTVPAGGITA